MRRLVATALELVERLYVHLPLKRSMYAVNPVQRLRLLQRRLDLAVKPMSERDFYDDMLGTFGELRDLHTTFVLPEPFRSHTAFMPFSIEACKHRNARQFVVSHVFDRSTSQLPEEMDKELAKAERRGFARGAVITHWNGVEIERAVALNAQRELGSNPAARLAQGIASMTVRWLGQSLPPDEKWVDVQFKPAPGRACRPARFRWGAFQQHTTGTGHGVAKAAPSLRHAIGMDERCEVERQVRRKFFHRPFATPRGETRVVGTMDDVFPVCRNVSIGGERFGYLRIATFNVERAEPFLQEFAALVGQLSRRGLIIDVRGNGGGLITAGERLLQRLTPGPIEPARFHFLNTPRTAGLAARSPFLADWRSSIEQAVETGSDFSQGFPLSSVASCNDTGQIYQGPVVLITDALCYSTTDIFAAGFQDHRIGTILGVDDATGAGGANVWEYALIAQLAGDSEGLPSRLPRDASFRCAVRRVTRVGANAGLPLEDLGVRPDVVHRLTRRDVLERNVDLIARAARILVRQPTQQLSAALQPRGVVTIRSDNIDRVDMFLDGHPFSSRPLRVGAPRRRSARHSGAVTFAATMPTAKSAAVRTLRIEGFRREKLVAATRLKV